MDSHYHHATFNASQGGNRHLYGGLPSYPNQYFESQPNHQTLPPPSNLGPGQDLNLLNYAVRSQEPTFDANSNFPAFGHVQPVQDGYMSSAQQSNTYNSVPSSQYHAQPPPFNPGPEMQSAANQLGSMRHNTVGMGYPSMYASSFANQAMHSMPMYNAGDHLSSPVHVVGSQGRRGILPADEGRPAALTEAGTPTAKTAAVPMKDADGKYPCQHCNKTYLHAKHLKRHMLRHTGLRPYTCILCNDSFSRSDILKRHFQKCSIRRGNPTGATHLSNTSTYLRRQSAKKANGTLNTEKGQLQEKQPQIVKQEPGTSGFQSASTPVSRSNSGKRNAAQSVRDRSMTGPARPTYDSLGFSQMDSHHLAEPLDDDQLSQAESPLEEDSAFNTGPSASTPELVSDSNRNSLPHILQHSYGDRQGFDWPFSGDEQPDFSQMHQSFAEGDIAQSRPPTSSGSPNHGNSDYLPGLPCNTSHDDVNLWNLPHQRIDMYEVKVRKLATFAYLGQGLVGENELQFALSPDNMEHFIQRFRNFQIHWPVIHCPSFEVADAYDGLVLCMICVGAVYSKRLNIHQVRTLMERIQIVMKQQSTLYKLIHTPNIPPAYLMSIDKEALQELQALSILHAQFLWHGTPAQQQLAMNDHGAFVRLARQYKMFAPTPPGSPIWSWLHQPQPELSSSGVESWKWHDWIYQEKRSRLMYILALLDWAMVMYFNCPPQIDPMELRLPLPADDAAFEATTATECAMALGLHGSEAQNKNVTGSRRRKQPEMNLALKALLYGSGLPPGSTNALSKFILVHGLHVQIWKLQRQVIQGQFPVDSQGAPDLNAATGASLMLMLSTNNGLSAPSSTNTSGHVTPTDSSGTRSPTVTRSMSDILNALNKWKIAWDTDLILQFPHSAQRIGFCRDPVPFFELARNFLITTSPEDLQAPPAQRFQQVIDRLKEIKAQSPQQIYGDNSTQGSVLDIHEDYGIGDLSLDMKLLFTPVTRDTPSPALLGA